jgi:hypothetical protein
MVLVVLYWLLVILAAIGYIPAVNEKLGIFGRGIDLVLFIILGLKLFGLPT